MNAEQLVRGLGPRFTITVYDRGNEGQLAQHRVAVNEGEGVDAALKYVKELPAYADHQVNLVATNGWSHQDGPTASNRTITYRPDATPAGDGRRPGSDLGRAPRPPAGTAAPGSCNPGAGPDGCADIPPAER